MDQTPLHWAADTGSIGVVRTLLQHGAEPSAKDSTGATPAIRAAKSIYSTYPAYDTPKRQQVIKLLLEAGASFDEEDSSGVSVRNWAVDCGLSTDWREW
jgi:ankyrin repeat protein